MWHRLAMSSDMSQDVSSLFERAEAAEAAEAAECIGRNH